MRLELFHGRGETDDATFVWLPQQRVLMRESPRVVTRRDIEREIWGDGLPDSDTLRSHLYNLRKAIDRPFDKQLLHTVQTAGYRIADLGNAPA